MNNKIFISIASYRDHQLVPTILDCLNKAKNKNNLQFGICWQKDETENLKELESYKSQIKIYDCDWRESKGACWARNLIQKDLYDGEDYYLQLDSHHRFLEHWDDHLFDLLSLSKEQSKKSIIGTYGTTFWPKTNDPLKNEPYKINTFDAFGTDGDIISRPVYIKNHESLDSKIIKARLLSGHFIFTDGLFVQECMYDPNLYFRGEEITLSARAYTHGYDFYHPTYSIIWHEYLRKESHKHWLDHIKKNGFVIEGEDKNIKSKKRQRQLFGLEPRTTDFKNYDFGKERTLHDYELYCGLDFKKKRVHKNAHDINGNINEPYIMTEDEWNSGMLKSYEMDIEWNLNDIEAKDDYDFWFFGFEDDGGNLLYRKDFNGDNQFNHKFFNKQSNRYKIDIHAEYKPTRCVIIPHSKSNGWHKKIVIGC